MEKPILEVMHLLQKKLQILLRLGIEKKDGMHE